jgi:uncharacterized OsmC-like protein
MTNLLYQAQGTNVPGGAASVRTLQQDIPFDGSAQMGDAVPGPAHLLASALAACVLKNVERFSQTLKFTWSRAEVHVELERQDSPPRIVTARYSLRLHTEESVSRCLLMHKNIRKFGTISNTLALACDLKGELFAERASGDVDAVDTVTEQ